MEGRKYSKKQYNNTITTGNLARTLQPVPNRQTTNKENVFVQRRAARKRKSNIKAHLFLIIAASLTLWMCVSYLRAQVAVQMQNRSILALERQLEKIENENAILEDQLNLTLDLDAIYKIATEELGMTYPNEDQVVAFDKKAGYYVNQFQDIPDEKSETISFLGIVIGR